ncbi:MAG: barstar family protein [Kiritimatiellae bacterium]|nr:barstar family protein [Kiritimatiellia bacterium]
MEAFYDAVTRVMITPRRVWRRNLDAFNDILRGGFGTPDEGFVIRWVNADISRQHLGYKEAVRQLKKRLTTCHSTCRGKVESELNLARRERGPTVFNWLVSIIHYHCPGRCEEEDNVELIIED